MATNNNIADLNFDKVKESLKTYLKGIPAFAGYNFEGSNLSNLLNVLAHNTYTNSFYLNMLANELFLDTASRRSTIVSIAKSLGYTPRSRKASSAFVNVTLTSSSPGASSYTLPRWSQFVASGGGESFFFYLTEPVTASWQDGQAVFQNIEIKEGVYRKFTFEFDSSDASQKFIIPDENVDVSTLRVVIQDSRFDTNQTVFSEFTDLTGVNSLSKIYFLQELDDGRFEILFGDGQFGAALANGNLVIIEYLTTNGEDANGSGSFSATFTDGVFSSSPSVSLYDPSSRSSGGAERETIESIKFRAPKSFEAQNRAVTSPNHKAKVLEVFPNIEAVSVTSGDEMNPPKFGKVFIAAKPKSSLYLTTSEKQNIENYFKENLSVVTIVPVVTNPEYIFVHPTLKVFYDPSQTARSASEIATSAKDSAMTFQVSSLGNFANDFYFSRFLAFIDDSLQGITHTRGSIKIEKRFNPLSNILRTFTLSFNNALDYPKDASEGFLTSSVFNYENKSCVFKDVRGVVNIYSASDGTLVKSSAGSVNYETGEVVVSNFSSSSATISIYVKPRETDLYATQNQILFIEENSIIASAEKTLE